MELTFAEMKALKTRDLSNLDFSNLVIASSMFSTCTSLESINIANFNPPKLESTGYMFSFCKKLKEVDLSSFEGDSLYYTTGKFVDTYVLTRIKIPYMKM